jgi:hypothetical protein
MNTYVHLWYYIAEFIVDWETFHLVYRIKNQSTYFFVHIIFCDDRAVDKEMWKNA